MPAGYRQFFMILKIISGSFLRSKITELKNDGEIFFLKFVKSLLVIAFISSFEGRKSHHYFRFLFSLDFLYIFHVAAAVMYFLHLFVQDNHLFDHFIARARGVLVLFISFVYLYDHSSIFNYKLLSVLTKPLYFIFNLYF